MIRRFENLPFLTMKSKSREEMYSKRPHSHGKVSLGYIESGNSTITVQSRKYLLTPGDLVLIPSRTVHICVPEDVGSFRFRMYYIDETWWSRQVPVAPDSFRTLALPETELFRQFMICEEADPAGSPGMERTLIDALSELAARYELSDINTHPAEAEIEKIHQLIREMPQASLSLDKLASDAGFNKYSFIRRYSGRYGLTPHADIINMRIQRAILLLETEMDLVDIALSCGFSDQSHFINQFKLYCGLRPLEYRKGIRGIQALSEAPAD